MEVKENVSQQEPAHDALENGGENSPDAGVLEKIKAEIKAHLDTSDGLYLEIGRLLLKAKSQFGKYGDWLKWLQKNVGFSICKAQRLMRVAEWVDSNEAPVPHLDFTKAYILSRLTKEELDAFLVGKQIENMSKRDLERAVRDYLKTKIQKNKSSVEPIPPKADNSGSVNDGLSDRFERIKRDVSEFADLVGSDSDKHDVFAVELRELCKSIVQRFSTKDG